MRIHCGQLVEGALRNALEEKPAAPAKLESTPAQAPTLMDSLATDAKRVRIKLIS
jgi:hypothetical protein